MRVVAFINNELVFYDQSHAPVVDERDHSIIVHRIYDDKAGTRLTYYAFSEPGVRSRPFWCVGPRRTARSSMWRA
jgi:hypothetical protein